MARTFVAASSQYLEYAGAVLSGVPLTLAAWCKPTVNATYVVTIAQFASASGTHFGLYATSGSTVGAITTLNGVGGIANSTANAPSTWCHVAGVYSATNARASFLNGGNKGTNTTSCTPSGLNRTCIGAIPQNSNHSQFFDGDIASVAVWNVALTDADIAALALGISPLSMRPDALVAHWSINGQYSPEIDVFGRYDLVLTGTPAAALDPPIFLPAIAHIVSARRYTIAGITKDRAGVALGSCTVNLYRTSDNVLLQTTVSDGSGVFSFVVPSTTQYYLVAYLVGSPDVAGTTVNTLVGV